VDGEESPQRPGYFRAAQTAGPQHSAMNLRLSNPPSASVSWSDRMPRQSQWPLYAKTAAIPKPSHLSWNPRHPRPLDVVLANELSADRSAHRLRDRVVHLAAQWPRRPDTRPAAPALRGLRKPPGWLTLTQLPARADRKAPEPRQSSPGGGPSLLLFAEPPQREGTASSAGAEGQLVPSASAPPSSPGAPPAGALEPLAAPLEARHPVAWNGNQLEQRWHPHPLFCSCRPCRPARDWCCN